MQTITDTMSSEIVKATPIRSCLREDHLKMHYLTTTEAAGLLKITPRRIRALIESGKLPAERIGRDWAIKPKDLDRLDRRPGQPRKDSQ